MAEMNCVCPICGVKFHLKPSVIKKYKNNYCSKECHRLAKMEYMKGEKNHQYGLKGEKNASWGGKMRRINQYGYIQVRVPDHPFAMEYGWVMEHRLEAEKHLLNETNSVEIDGKRYLSPDYVVHHINFDRKDNSIENLLVMTKEEHSYFHAKLNGRERDETGKFIKDEMPVKIKKVTETAIVPTKGTEGSAGFDLYVDSDEVVTIPPHGTAMLQTNIAFEIPRGYFGAVYARSGVSTKRGLRPATCVSVIDSDYRGSVGVPLHNDTDEPRIVLKYERVAQMVITPIPEVELVLVDNLSDTERGTGGFGSSGRR
jgi:dUTP pyrophosphatase